MNIFSDKIYIRVGYLFLLFSFFPFITFFKTPFDLQPFSLVFAIILVFLCREKPNLYIFYFILISIFAFLLLINSSFNLNSIRSFANYISLFFITYASYLVFHKISVKQIKKILIMSFSIWIIVGIIQTSMDSSFLNSLLSSARGSGFQGRGVLGLAPEPTMYGIVLLFFGMIGFVLFDDKIKYMFILISLLSIIFLSKSSLVLFLLILCISVFFLIYLLFCKPILFIFFILLVVPIYIFILIILDNIESQIRFLIILEKLLNDPIHILEDGSLNDRYLNIYFSIKGLIDGWFLPNGYGYWGEYFLNSLQDYKGYVSNYVSFGSKPLSGFGSVLFEMGIIGVAMLFMISKIIVEYFNKYEKKGLWLFLIILNLLMLNAVPIALPFLGFLLGYFIYKIREKDDKITYNPQ